MSNTDTILDYNCFLADLRSNGLEHWARVVEKTDCKIMISFPKNISSDRETEYIIWCKENCNARYFVYNENHVFFKTEEDAIAFKLRWL